MSGPRLRYGQCLYCGETGVVTDDHILPKFLGGTRAQVNVVDACVPCNRAKGRMHPEVWLARHLGAERLAVVEARFAATQAFYGLRWERARLMGG